MDILSRLLRKEMDLLDRPTPEAHKRIHEAAGKYVQAVVETEAIKGNKKAAIAAWWSEDPSLIGLGNLEDREESSKGLIRASTQTSDGSAGTYSSLGG